MSNKGLPQSRRQCDLDIRRGGTDTTAGFVPHLDFRGISCPVMLVTTRTPRGRAVVMNWQFKPRPVRRGNCYVYALPGGYTVEGPIR
jgi:hypothetical protein